MQLAVSTIAFIGKPIEEIISIAQQENYVLEFSSGLPFHENIEELFVSSPLKKYAHNYFPAPKEPFVLNLASTNIDIRNRSINHCINGLRLSSLVNAPFFSAHAGFCVDPQPVELGQELKKNKNIDRQANWNLFIDSVTHVLDATKDLSTLFLIENNVLAKMNVYEDGTNPLLCVDGKESHQLITSVNNIRLGLLLDTAHFKVSANTLHFSIQHELQLIQPFVKCVHHSDNDGLFDTNGELTERYWFLKHVPDYKNVLHVLEVKKQTTEQINYQLNLLKKQ